MLVIDSGFSFTHVVPMIDGRVIWKAVKRSGSVMIPSDGGLLTSQILVDSISVANS
jgi:actin-related protein 6